MDGLGILVRALATAGVVIAVTLAVGRLGARRGGLLAGLPIVLGPGFAVLAITEDAGFVARAAAWSLVSLAATQAFMLAYAVVARAGAGVWLALAAAILAWAAAALVLARTDLDLLSALALYAAATALALAAHRRLATGEGPKPAPEGIVPLLLRGALAGTLVAGVTVGARELGPALAGLLLAYPVGMTVIAAGVHRRLGAGAVVATLRAVALGMASLAAFCSTIAVAAPALGGPLAVLAALGAAVAATALLMRVTAAP